MDNDTQNIENNQEKNNNGNENAKEAPKNNDPPEPVPQSFSLKDVVNKLQNLQEQAKLEKEFEDSISGYCTQEERISWKSAKLTPEQIGLLVAERIQSNKATPTNNQTQKGLPSRAFTPPVNNHERVNDRATTQPTPITGRVNLNTLQVTWSDYVEAKKSGTLAEYWNKVIEKSQ